MAAPLTQAGHTFVSSNGLHVGWGLEPSLSPPSFLQNSTSLDGRCWLVRQPWVLRGPLPAGHVPRPSPRTTFMPDGPGTSAERGLRSQTLQMQEVEQTGRGQRREAPVPGIHRSAHKTCHSTRNVVCREPVLTVDDRPTAQLKELRPREVKGPS